MTMKSQKVKINKTCIKKIQLIDLSDNEEDDDLIQSNNNNNNNNNSKLIETAIDMSHLSQEAKQRLYENEDGDEDDDCDDCGCCGALSEACCDTAAADTVEETTDGSTGTADKKTRDYDILLIEKQNIDSDEPKIMKFINFCIKDGLFDNTFYDYGNAFSVVATKLPIIFEKLSTDGENIQRNAFIDIFKKHFKYKGDIKFIYEYIDKDEKGYITWEEFTGFYLPFVKYTTM